MAFLMDVCFASEIPKLHIHVPTSNGRSPNNDWVNFMMVPSYKFIIEFQMGDPQSIPSQAEDDMVGDDNSRYLTKFV